MTSWALHRGDCLDMLRAIPDCSVDAIVCDPPYGLSKEPDLAGVLRHWLAGDDYEHRGSGFMGKTWDSFVPGPAVWRECLRVLKPGGHLVAFASTRTEHLMGVAIALAGFERRDTVHWCYVQGFPKSLDVSKAIDKAAGAEREVVGSYTVSRDMSGGSWGDLHGTPLSAKAHAITAPATPDAQRWSGWGTAVKPAIEPAVLARKPLQGTVAANVLRWGTGALNIDGCRFGYGDPAWVGPNDEESVRAKNPHTVGGITGSGVAYGGGRATVYAVSPTGRFPANLYYCPKASRSERERGCDDLPAITGAEAVDRAEGSAGTRSPRAGAGRTAAKVRNVHPTVKPVRLMRWLCRLVTPPGGLVVDPFTGSGTTGIAAALEGFAFHGAEMTPEYADIAAARIVHAHAHPEAWATTAPGYGARGGEVVELSEPVDDVPQLALFGGA